MIVRAEDRGKIIGLLSAIGVMAVLFVFRMMQVVNAPIVSGGVVAMTGSNIQKVAAPVTSPGPAVAVSTAPASTTPAPSAPPSGGGTMVALSDPAFSLSDSSTDQIDPPNLFASSSADPFRKIAQKAAPVVAPPVRRPRRELIRPMDPKFMDDAPAPLANPGSVPPIAASVDDFPKLNGVMPDASGDGVAVLSAGKDSYVLKKGQSFGAGYTILSITSSGVKLKKGSATLDLSVSN